MIELANGVLFHTILEKLDINLSNKFCIADFGSSTGPNTFIVTKNIIDAVMHKYQSMQETNPVKTTPEFHIFFNIDHVHNDFNTLFKALPQLRSYLPSKKQSQSYFAVGSAGFFLQPIVANGSLHVGHSSSAFHWLSKVPSEVMDESSPAWSKGKIYCVGNNKEVTKTYFAQFTANMDAFLKARAQELIDEGLVPTPTFDLSKSNLNLEKNIGQLYSLDGEKHSTAARAIIENLM